MKKFLNFKMYWRYFLVDHRNYRIVGVHFLADFHLVGVWGPKTDTLSSP